MNIPPAAWTELHNSPDPIIDWIEMQQLKINELMNLPKANFFTN